MKSFNNQPKASTSGAVSRRFSTTELECAAEAYGLVALAERVFERGSEFLFKVLRRLVLTVAATATVAVIVAVIVIVAVFFFAGFSQAPDSSIAPAPTQVPASQQDTVVTLGTAPSTCACSSAGTCPQIAKSCLLEHKTGTCPCSGADSSLCARPDFSR